MHLIPPYSNSQSAIVLTKDGSYHTHTKHINIRCHFKHFAVDSHSFYFIYCPTEDIITDPLAKALPTIKANYFTTALGLHTN
ncbi:hypothetical protein ID866_9721 [Astraeus odoratus]|nr:hypothetical protein ID866_9721 [Astraeus odoratus]